jgi:protein arginine kinase activator
MLCNNCHKNEATIHIQEVMDGKKKAIHLCASCAAEKSQDQGIGDFNIAQLLYNITEKLDLPGLTEALQGQNKGQPEQPPEAGAPQQAAEPAAETAQPHCSVCGWNSEKLRQTGRLGCPNCYRVFRAILDKAIPNMHRGKTHIGKSPAGNAQNAAPRQMSELMNLQKELEIAIQDERYEDAAKLRDRINHIRQNMEKE